MSHELHYTSAPRGLKAGRIGYTTVGATANLPGPLADRLEGLSGYRAVYPASHPMANKNPSAVSYYKVNYAGESFHVLSRVSDAGLDYSQRDNKYAHHVALTSRERPEGGPGWLAAQPGFLDRAWIGEPRLIANGRRVPSGAAPSAVCHHWKHWFEDAGWAGVIADSVLVDPERPVTIVFDPGQDVLPLFGEILALLPRERRWEYSFCTYYTGQLQGLNCNWRGVLRGSPEEQQARRAAGGLIFDTQTPPGQAPTGRLVEQARTGTVTPELERPISRSTGPIVAPTRPSPRTRIEPPRERHYIGEATSPPNAPPAAPATSSSSHASPVGPTVAQLKLAAENRKRKFLVAWVGIAAGFFLTFTGVMGFLLIRGLGGTGSPDQNLLAQTDLQDGIKSQVPPPTTPTKLESSILKSGNQAVPKVESKPTLEPVRELTQERFDRIRDQVIASLARGNAFLAGQQLKELDIALLDTNDLEKKNKDTCIALQKQINDEADRQRFELAILTARIYQVRLQATNLLDRERTILENVSRVEGWFDVPHFSQAYLDVQLARLVIENLAKRVEPTKLVGLARNDSDKERMRKIFPNISIVTSIPPPQSIIKSTIPTTVPPSEKTTEIRSASGEPDRERDRQANQPGQIVRKEEEKVVPIPFPRQMEAVPSPPTPSVVDQTRPELRGSVRAKVIALEPFALPLARTTSSDRADAFAEPKKFEWPAGSSPELRLLGTEGFELLNSGTLELTRPEILKNLKKWTVLFRSSTSPPKTTELGKFSWEDSSSKLFFDRPNENFPPDISKVYDTLKRCVLKITCTQAEPRYLLLRGPGEIESSFNMDRIFSQKRIFQRLPLPIKLGDTFDPIIPFVGKCVLSINGTPSKSIVFKTSSEDPMGMVSTDIDLPDRKMNFVVSVVQDKKTPTKIIFEAQTRVGETWNKYIERFWSYPLKSVPTKYSKLADILDYAKTMTVIDNSPPEAKGTNPQVEVDKKRLEKFKAILDSISFITDCKIEYSLYTRIGDQVFELPLKPPSKASTPNSRD